jgi:hypothetical protein
MGSPYSFYEMFLHSITPVNADKIVESVSFNKAPQRRKHGIFPGSGHNAGIIFEGFQVNNIM